MRRLLVLGLLVAMVVTGQTDVPGHLTVAPDQTNNLDACVKLMSLSGGNTAGICAPASLSGSYTVVMPGSNSAGVLTNDGSGGLSWGASSAPPYADTTVMMSSDTAGGHIYKGYSNTSAVFFGMDFYRYGGTIATPADMPASGTMMWLRAYGQRNSSLQESGGIRMLGDGASGNYPTSMIRFTVMDSAGTKFNPLTLRANGELQITNSASLASGGFRFNGTNLQWSDDLSTWSNFSGGSNWTRAGTTLSPAIAGDGIAVDSVDAAPAADTGNYVKTRKFEFVDSNGGADFFDARAYVHAAGGQRYLEFRDNAGTALIQFWRQETGSVAVDYADVFVDLRPDTDGGQALGSTSAPRYWSSAAINTITANQLTPKSVGNSDIGATGGAFGDGYLTTLWNNQFRIDSGGGSDMFFEGNLLPWTNEGHDLGAHGSGWDVVYGRRWEAWDGTYARIVLNSPGAASNTGSAIAVANASGTSIFSLSYAGALTTVNVSATGNLYTYGVLELEDDDQSNYVRIQAPATVSSNYTITVPAADCSAGDFLTLGSSGTMSCSTPSGTGLPVADTQTIVKGSMDATKLIRFEVDGLTASTTRVLTAPDADITIAGTNIAQTWTATQTMRDIAMGANESYNIGSTSSRVNNVYGRRWESYDGTYSRIVLNNPGSGSNTGSAVSILNASGTSVFSVSYGGTTSVTNLSISGTCTGCGGLPVVDTTSIVEGSVDPTKEVRIEADGITAGTVRVWTAPNADITVAGINLAQTWTAAQTFSADVTTRNHLPESSTSYDIGSSGALWRSFYFLTSIIQNGTTRVDSSGNANFARLDIGGTTTLNSSRQWNTGVGSFNPSSSASVSLGGISNYWLNLYISSSLVHNGTTRIDGSGNFNAASLQINATTRINSSSAWSGVNFLPASDGTLDHGSQSARWVSYYAATAYYIYDGTYTRFQASGGSVVGRNSSGTTQWTISTTNGTMEVLNWYIANGTAGQTATKTVRDSAGTGTCTLVFTGGIYTGGTC